ncbi:MAG: PAS domain S-box protein [Proteobacteria bacterium]|nr:PAS domain S-box protein [Pseudomonadota bacterium]
MLVMVLLAVGAMLGYFQYAEHREIEYREGERLQTQARVIGENLERQLEGVNNALAGIRDDLLQFGAKGMSVSPSRRLKTLSGAMTGVRTLIVTNADGMALDSNRDVLIGQNFSEREWYKTPRERPNLAMLYVSAPFETVLGVVAVNVTRAVVDPRGEFAGVVSASLDPEYFNVLLRSVLYAPDMRVAVVQEGMVGMNLANPGSFFVRHRDSGQIATLLSGTAAVSSDARLMASRTISRAGVHMDKPLVVHVSRSLAAMYLPWREQSIAYGTLFGLFALIAGIVLYPLQRRRQMADRLAVTREAERRESAERLELALAGANLGLWDWHVPSGKMQLNERWFSMLGYRRDEVEPDIGSWEKLVHPEDAPFVHAALDKHFRNEAPGYETEHRLRHKDGHWVWILDRGRVVERDAAGVPVRVVGTYMDVTERRRVDDERKQFLRFFELSLDPMCIADPFGCFKQVNPAFLKLTGYGESDLLARPFMEFIAPEDRERTAEEMKLQVAVRPSMYFENRYVCKDGRNVNLTWMAYFDKSDGVTYAIARDITEQKRKEAEYHTVIQASTDGFWIVDGDGRFLEVNQAVCRMMGYSREEFLRLTLADIVIGASPAEIAARTQEVREAGSMLFAARHRRKDGAIIDVEVSIQYVPALGERLFVFVRDITERKIAEEELKKSVALRELLSEAMPLPVFHKDAAGRYVGCNSAFSRFIGRTREDIIGKTVFDLAPHNFAENYRDRDLDLLNDPAGMQTYEGTVPHADGTDHSVIFHKARITDQNGTPTGIVGVITDITELKLVQVKRDQLEGQLRESQKMEALGTLAGGVAHDFNNIIAAIMGNVELARQDVGPGHLALESLEEISKASLRAKDLVQQILAFGRRQPASRKVISLAPVVEESARLLRTTLPAGVELKVECESEAPAVLADATQVEQVLLNLCNNAWHAIQTQARTGRIDVRLRAHERGAVPAQSAQIAFASGEMQPGRYACLEVQDNGSGMDRETVARIFEPFFTTKPVDKGTGLGLAVVHGIVQDHGACIEVQSVPGEGSTFCVYFPATQESGQAVQVRAPGAVPAHGEGKHVLFVDDDESIVFLMTRLLERQGYRVSGFTDAREALAAARANPEQFDLAVTDFNMPGMSGLDVARELREIRPGLPVAVASGYITDELRAQAPAVGVRELVYKPNTVDELCEVVSRLARELRD